jgi:hypothetical protein
VKCGEEIRVKDLNGSYVIRYIAQCYGRFLTIASGISGRNGWMVADWHAVLRDLVAETVPRTLIERISTVESTADGTYNCVPLSYPLSVSGLAGVLGVPADEVRAQLDDLVVLVDS